MKTYKVLAKPFLFRMDPERAHNITMRMMHKTHNRSARKITRFLFDYQSENLSQSLLGLTFRNPIGIAAGFDKNGTVIKAFEPLGFGFSETGSITANPSAGNPKPRLFRLPKDRAVINRMGLNNDGVEVVVKRLSGIVTGIPKGINIAKTHDPSITGSKAIEDYLKSYRIAEPAADYITLNISCPNTSDGKTFEQKEPLKELLKAVYDIRSDQSPPPAY